MKKPDENEITFWLKTLGPGERCVYYKGHLFKDRQPGKSPHWREIGIIANCAWEQMELGRVHLIQKRCATNQWEYIAVGAHLPHERVVWQRGLPQTVAA